MTSGDEPYWCRYRNCNLPVAGDGVRTLTRRVSLAVLISVLLLTAGCQPSTQFPDQPVTIICPWAAGGGTDRISRQMAVFLERELGVPVNVINATGGSGVTGHTRGALARADGHTLTMLTVELSMLHWRGLTTLTHQDFAPLMLLNRDDAAVFVRADSPLHTLDDLEAAIRSQTGKLKASGTAQGGVWHVAVAGWLVARGMTPGDANWISINGAGPSLQELLANGVDFVCCALPEADALYAGGQIRCLGVMADQRVASYPAVPTFREQGHDWSLAGWRGLGAPRETPPERLAVISAALDRIVASDDFRSFMDQSGFYATIEDPDTFRTTLQRQDQLFGDLLTGPAFRSVSDDHFGPYLFPSATAALLLLTGAVVFRDIRRTAVAGETPVDAQGSWRGAIAVLLAAIFYLLAAESLGFVLTATVMLSSLMWLLQVRPWVAVTVSVIASGLVWLVFSVGLRVPLPRGWLGW